MGPLEEAVDARLGVRPCRGGFVGGVLFPNRALARVGVVLNDESSVVLTRAELTTLIAALTQLQSQMESF